MFAVCFLPAIVRRLARGCVRFGFVMRMLLPSTNPLMDTRCGYYHRSRCMNVAMQVHVAKQPLVPMNVHHLSRLVKAVVEVEQCRHFCRCLDRGQKTYKNPRYELNPAQSRAQ